VQGQLDKNSARIHLILAEQPKLGRAKQLSLPPDVDFSNREYEKHLFNLMQDSGIESPTITPKPVDAKSGPMINKVPVYTQTVVHRAGQR